MDQSVQQQQLLNQLNMQQNMFTGEAFNNPHSSTDFADLMSPFLMGDTSMSGNDDMQEDDDSAQPGQPTPPTANGTASSGTALQAQQAAAAAMYISPELTPQLNPVPSPKGLAPITPSQLMKMDQRPKEVSIAPVPPSLVSPSLKPLLPQGSASKNIDAAIRLAQKSNYQNILEGDTEVLGLQYSSDISTGVEIRRTSHKQAEQRRRDSLKQCFEELKQLLPPVEEKNPSKVIILKKAYEYIEHMQKKERETQALIAKLEAEISASKGVEGGGGKEGGKEGGVAAS
ncbi:hypothetical protein HDV00_004677 [Rhizophlyctis rosea]|nr:hypothetical protein HDV00_004677 [Rhizophlyctis rosea]